MSVDVTPTYRRTSSRLRTGANLSTAGTVVIDTLTGLTTGLRVELPAAMTPDMIGAMQIGTR